MRTSRPVYPRHATASHSKRRPFAVTARATSARSLTFEAPTKRPDGPTRIPGNHATRRTGRTRTKDTGPVAVAWSAPQHQPRRCSGSAQPTTERRTPPCSRPSRSKSAEWESQSSGRRSAPELKPVQPGRLRTEGDARYPAAMHLNGHPYARNSKNEPPETSPRTGPSSPATARAAAP